MPRIIRIDDLEDARAQMRLIGAGQAGIDIMAPKSVFRAVKIEDISVVAANILKQDMLSRGGEAATSYGTIDHSSDKTDVILTGTLAQYSGLLNRLKTQQFGLGKLAFDIEKTLAAYDNMPAPILGMDFGKRTYIMGILNVTPDSFSDGSLYSDPASAVKHATTMLSNGADIIDVGGESTRPGAKEVPAQEEIDRVVPVIKTLRKERPSAMISIDTRKSSVAAAALEAGANMVNDVSALRFDSGMAATIARAKAPVVLMHSKGLPENMQNDPRYGDVIAEIVSSLQESISAAVKAGVDESNIIIDPGIGFGKTAGHNIEILRRLEELRCLGRPVCLGTSRKSFIGSLLGEEDPSKRDEGTASTIAIAISKKVDIIRVHNTSFMVKVAKISDKITRRIPG